MSRLSKILASAIILLGYAFWPVSQLAAEEQHVMPKELEYLASSIGCEVPADHYKNPATLEPPFLYGVLPGIEENSVAFWCRKRVENKISMLLVLAEFEKPNEYEISETRHGKVISYNEFNQNFASCGLTRWDEKDVHLVFFLKLPLREPYVGENVRTEVWPMHAKRGYRSCGVYYYFRGDWYVMPLD